MIDLLFIHTPKFQNYYPPLGYFMSITKMPAGLLGLADIASQEKISVKVIHLGVEKILDPDFSLKSFLLKETPKMVGISLHFHPQSHDVCKTIKAVKAALPEAFIFLGGYTASFFAEEILKDYPEVDAVLSGDAEFPLKQLIADILKMPSSLEHIPNLVWRNFHSKSITRNKPSYTNSCRDLAGYSRTNLSLMLHADTYLHLAQFLHFYRLDKSMDYHLQWIKHMDGFPLPLVRGCPFSCSYCGGGKEAQLKINYRNQLAYIPVSHVIEELKNLCLQGIQIFFMEYVPLGDGDQYYSDLFQEIEKIHLPLHANIECRSLPSRKFLLAFSKTFPHTPYSRLVFSFDSISEALRKKIRKGMEMTHENILNTLEFMELQGIVSEIFYSIGLPEEPIPPWKEIHKQIFFLRTRFKNILAIRIHSVELDPASPLFSDPKKFNITRQMNTFKDYCLYHSSPHSMFDGLGYAIADFENPAQKNQRYASYISDEICRNYCRALSQFSWKYPLWIRKLLNRMMFLFCRLKRKWDLCLFKKMDPFPY